jgi:hypothetical protein
VANKCIVCGATEVNTSDGICEICALSGQDPYILALNNTTTEQSTQNPIMPSQNFSSEISVKGSGKSRKILLNGGANSANINNNVVSNPSANNTLIYPAGHNFSASVTNTILSAGQIPVNNQQVN